MESLDRAVALRCFENAAALHDDANILLEAERDARAASLSIIGLEEYSKGFLFAIAALELVPNLSMKLAAAAGENPSRDHLFKQSLASTASMAHHLIRESNMSFGERAATAPVEWAAAVLSGLAEWITESGAAEGRKERRDFLRRERERRGDLSEGLPAGFQASLEDTKWAGLYVDVAPGGELILPSSMSHSAAEVLVVELRVSLRDAGPLRVVLASETDWAKLQNQASA